MKFGTRRWIEAFVAVTAMALVQPAMAGPPQRTSRGTERPEGNDQERMLVLTDQDAAAATRTQGTKPSAAQVFSSKNEDWKAPELRMTVEEFKRLEAAGEVLVVDVRDPQSYRRGHLPGAILLTPEELSTEEGRATLKGEKRTIVAYCS